MKPSARDQAAGGGSSGVDMRRAQRYVANNISVPMGRVTDLSATGMRLQCPRKEAPTVGSMERFVLSNGTQRIAIKGQIVRVRKPLWPKAPCEVGVRFLDASAGVRVALEQLGKYGFVQGGKHETGFKSAPASGPSTVQPAPRAQQQVPPRGEVRASVEVGDLYKMLEISPEATDEEIRAAYRVKARMSHPDASDDPHAEQIFTDLAKAYKVLIDPALRSKYDSLFAGQPDHAAPAGDVAA